MAEQFVIDVVPRDDTGKNASRRLRRAGRVPATLYGEGKDPVAVSVDAFILDRMLHSETGENTIFELHHTGSGRRRPAMVKDIQLDPVTDRLIHADFIRIEAGQLLQVDVHVELEGTPIGVKVDGGRLENPIREVEVECLPKDIPAKLSVDITGLRVGQTIRAADLVLPPGVTLLTEPELTLATLHAKEEEEAPVAEEEVAPATPTTPAPEKPSGS